METEYSCEVKNYYIVSEKSLKEISKLLRDRIGSIKVSAGCKDGAFRSFKSIDELLKYDNMKSKEIQYLSLSAYSSDVSKTATVIFGRTGISINCKARDDVSSSLFSKLSGKANRMKSWYSFLRATDFPLTIILYLGSALVVSALCSIPILFFLAPDVIVHDYPESKLASLWIPNSLTLFFCLYLFRLKVFPTAVFKIGDGLSRAETLEKIRWVVVALLASLVVTLILALLR